MSRVTALLAGLAVLGMASPAQAAVSEVDLLVIPAKQPRWVYGMGTVQLSAWTAGYTAWGSLGASVDLLLGPDFDLAPSMLYFEVEPVLSIPKVLGRPIPQGYGLTDAGLTVQVKNGLVNERYQPLPLSLAIGPSLELGGTWIDGLRLDLMWRFWMPYTESYEIAYVDVDASIAEASYDDVWPIKPGLSVAVSWFHTWQLGPTEVFTRGMVDVWQQAFREVEQWPEDRPGEHYAGPTWEVSSSSWRVLAQPQLGLRFGKTLAYSVALEVELAHQAYLVPESDLSSCVDPINSDEGSYCLRRDPFTTQVGLLAGLRF